MLPITDALARRLETAEAVDAAGCAEALCRLDVISGATVKALAGGMAVFCGTESPLTHAPGIGMHGPVTAEELDELEAFFEDRGATVSIDLCPHADPSLRELIAERTYRVAEFVNVMVRSLPLNSPVADLAANAALQVRRAEPEEHESYVRAVIGGFFGRAELTDEERRLGSILFHMPCTEAYLGVVDGLIVGGGGLSLRNRVASLFGDATLPEYRHRGVHAALIRARMESASAQGCELITAGTVPGSASQRNYERLGFRVAYTKIIMAKS